MASRFSRRSLFLQQQNSSILRNRARKRNVTHRSNRGSCLCDREGWLEVWEFTYVEELCRSHDLGTADEFANQWKLAALGDYDVRVLRAEGLHQKQTGEEETANHVIVGVSEYETWNGAALG